VHVNDDVYVNLSLFVDVGVDVDVHVHVDGSSVFWVAAVPCQVIRELSSVAGVFKGFGN
jgi:hypothetical protein